MCTVSMVGDHYNDMFKPKPWYPQIAGGFTDAVVYVSREEFNELKRQVAEMTELLKRAKAYDEANHEPDCEVEEKMDLLRKVARMVGVDLDAALAAQKSAG